MGISLDGALVVGLRDPFDVIARSCVFAREKTFPFRLQFGGVEEEVPIRIISACSVGGHLFVTGFSIPAGSGELSIPHRPELVHLDILLETGYGTSDVIH